MLTFLKKNKISIIVLLFLSIIGIVSFVFIAGAWLKYDRSVINNITFNNGVVADIRYLSENQGILDENTTLNFYVSKYNNNTFSRPQLMSSENFKSIVPNDYLVIENASITPNASSVPYYLRAKWVVTYNGEEIDESLWGFYNLETIPELNSTYWEKGKDGFYYNKIKEQNLNSYTSLNINKENSGAILFFEENENKRVIKFADENSYNWDFIYYYETNKLGLSLLIETIQASKDYLELNWSPFSDKNLVNDITQFEYRIDNENNLIIDKYIGNSTDITIDSKMILSAQQILDGQNKFNGTNNTLNGSELSAIYTVKNIQGLNNKLKNIELPNTIETINPNLLNGYNYLESFKVNSNVTINLPTLQREDYTFEGWYQLENLNDELILENKFTGNTLLPNKYYKSSIVKNVEILEDNLKDYAYRVNTETNEIEIIMYKGDKTEYKIPSTMFLTADQINFGYINYAQRQKYDNVNVTVNKTIENAVLNVVYVEKIKSNTLYLELGNNISSLNPTIFNKAYYLKTLKTNNSFDFSLPTITHNQKTLLWYYFSEKQENFVIDINKIVENTNENGAGYYYTAWLDGLDNPTTTLADYDYIIDENDNLFITSYNGYKKSIIVPESLSLSAVEYYNGRKAYDSNIVLDLNFVTGKTLSVKKVIGLNKKLEEVVLPNNLTEISKNLFSDSKLQKITMPSTITKIESQAFANCYNLKSIYCNNNGEITEGLNNTNLSIIEENAFYRCTSLESIDIPSTISNIGNYSFYNCNKMLINISNSNNLSYIGDYAFALTKIKNINISSNLLYLGQFSFAGCSDLEIVSNLENTNITEIKPSTFEGCSSLYEISIPDTAIIIYEKAFKDCTSLVRINVSEYTTDIYSEAFSGCTKLRIIYNFEYCKILKIAEKLFYNCSSLKYIEYPTCVTKLESLCFGNCTSLETIEISENVNEVSNDFIDGCNNIITIACLSKKLYSGNFTYSLQINGETITLVPSHIQYEIVDNKYYINKYSLSATGNCFIPSYLVIDGVIQKVYGIKLNNEEEFFDTTNGSILNSLKISEGVKEIKENVFTNNNVNVLNIRSLILPDSIKVISSGNFNNFTKNRIIGISAHINYVGSNCFESNSDVIYVDVISNFTNKINLENIRNVNWKKYDNKEKTTITNKEINSYGLYYFDFADKSLWSVNNSEITGYVGEETAIYLPETIVDLATREITVINNININTTGLTIKIAEGDIAGDSFAEYNFDGLAENVIIENNAIVYNKLINLKTKKYEINETTGTLGVSETEIIHLYGDYYFSFASSPIKLKELYIDVNLTNPITFILPFLSGSVYKDLNSAEESVEKIFYPNTSNYDYIISEAGTYSFRSTLICNQNTKSSEADGLTAEEYERNIEVYDVINTFKYNSTLQEFTILIDIKNKNIYIVYLKYNNAVTIILPSVAGFTMYAFNLNINAENKNVVIPEGYIIQSINFVDANDNEVIANSVTISSNVTVNNNAFKDLKVKNYIINSNIYKVNVSELENITLKGDYNISFDSTDLKLQTLTLESDLSSSNIINFTIEYYEGDVYKDDSLYHHSNDMCIIQNTGVYVVNYYSTNVESNNNIEITTIIDNKGNKVYVVNILDNNSTNSIIELPVITGKTMIIESLYIIKESGNLSLVIPDDYQITSINEANSLIFEKLTIGENVTLRNRIVVTNQAEEIQIVEENFFKQFNVKEYEISSSIGEIENTDILEKITIHNDCNIYFTNYVISNNNLSKLNTIIIDSLLTNPLQLQVHINSKSIKKSGVVCKSDNNYIYYLGAESITVDENEIILDTGIGTYTISDTELDTEFNNENLTSSIIYDDPNKKILYIYSLTYGESATDVTLPTKEGYKIILEGTVNCEGLTNVTIPDNDYQINKLITSGINNLYVNSSVVVSEDCSIKDTNYYAYYDLKNDYVYIQNLGDISLLDTVTLPVIMKDETTPYKMIAYKLVLDLNNKNLIIPDNYKIEEMDIKHMLCSKLYERYILGYNGTRVNISYDDCNPFGMIAGDFGEITSLSKHTSQSASNSTIVSFNNLSYLFADFMNNFIIPTDGTIYNPIISEYDLNEYTQFYDKAIELYNDSFVSFTKNVGNDLTKSAVIGVNHPYTMAFGSDVSPELIDFQAVIANLFGFSSKTEFMNYAQDLADTYAEHRINITNSEAVNEALDNGCFYTSNGSFVFPIAIKNELSSPVLTYVILDREGFVSVWVNDITAALLATNFNSSYYTGRIINNELYCKNILFVKETLINKITVGENVEIIENWLQKFDVINYEISSDVGNIKNRYLKELTINGDYIVNLTQTDSSDINFEKITLTTDLTKNTNADETINNLLKFKLDYIKGSVYKDLPVDAINTIDYIYYHTNTNDLCNINTQGVYTFNYFLDENTLFNYKYYVDTIEKNVYLTEYEYSYSSDVEFTLPFFNNYTTYLYNFSFTYDYYENKLIIPDNYKISGKLLGQYKKITIGQNIEFKDINYINSNTKTEVILENFFQGVNVKELDVSCNIGYCENNNLEKLTINGDYNVSFENYDLNNSSISPNLTSLKIIEIKQSLSNPILIKSHIKSQVIKLNGNICSYDENYVYSLSDIGQYTISYTENFTDDSSNGLIDSSMIIDHQNKILYISYLDYDLSAFEDKNIRLYEYSDYKVIFDGYIYIKNSDDLKINSITIPSTYTVDLFRIVSYYSYRPSGEYGGDRAISIINTITLEEGAIDKNNNGYGYSLLEYITDRNYNDYYDYYLSCNYFVNENEKDSNNLPYAYVINIDVSQTEITLPVIENKKMVINHLYEKEFNLENKKLIIPDNYLIVNFNITGVLQELNIGKNVTFENEGTKLISWYYKNLTIDCNVEDINIKYLQSLTIKGNYNINSIDFYISDEEFLSSDSLKVILQSDLNNPPIGPNVKSNCYLKNNGKYELYGSYLDSFVNPKVSYKGEYLFTYLSHSSSGDKEYYIESCPVLGDTKYLYLTDITLNNSNSTKLPIGIMGCQSIVLYNTNLTTSGFSTNYILEIPSNYIFKSIKSFSYSNQIGLKVKAGVKYLGDDNVLHNLSEETIKNEFLDKLIKFNFTSLIIEDLSMYYVSYVEKSENQYIFPSIDGYIMIADFEEYLSSSDSIYIPDNYRILNLSNTNSTSESSDFVKLLTINNNVSYCNKYGEEIYYIYDFGYFYGTSNELKDNYPEEPTYKKTLLTDNSILSFKAQKISIEHGSTNKYYNNYYKYLSSSSKLQDEIDNKTSDSDTFNLYKFKTDDNNLTVPSGYTIISLSKSLNTLTIEENVVVEENSLDNIYVYENLIISSNLTRRDLLSINKLTINNDVTINLSNNQVISTSFKILINTTLTNSLKITTSNKVLKDGVELTPDQDGKYSLSEIGEYTFQAV